MSRPKWGSSFYKGAAEAAEQEADEAAKFDFRGRAAQLAMAARDIAALESINAELLEALEALDTLMDFSEPIASNTAITFDNAKAINAAMQQARAAIAAAKGDGR